MRGRWARERLSGRWRSAGRPAIRAAAAPLIGGLPLELYPGFQDVNGSYTAEVYADCLRTSTHRTFSAESRNFV